MRGDILENGEVNGDDLNILSQYVTGYTEAIDLAESDPLFSQVADLNTDQIVDVADIVYLASYLANIPGFNLVPITSIIDVFVDGGQNTNSDLPYYKFYLDPTGSVRVNQLNVLNTYRFRRLGNATSHPFYISDLGYEQVSSKIELSGDGDPTNGIVDNQSFILDFKDFDKTTGGKLYYYCTVHPTMFGEFTLV